MADGIIYKNVVLITTLVESNKFDGKVLHLDFPVPIYGYNVVKDGRYITDYMGTTKSISQGLVAGDEVLAKVDYAAKDEGKVSTIPTIIKGDITEDSSYKDHYEVKNEDKYAIVGPDGSEIKYTGPEKDENAKFSQWID